MFTGIIETTGTVTEVIETGSNLSFWIASKLSDDLKIDQSVSHDGVCLTVDDLRADAHRVTAVLETLQLTSLSQWSTGMRINLERSVRAIDRLDGHIVQGHVDTTGICDEVSEMDGSWYFRFSYPEKYDKWVIHKGSICINGVSLTVVEPAFGSFQVAIIPYTWQHTNFSTLKAGDKVNIEFDVIGKYVEKQLAAYRIGMK